MGLAAYVTPPGDLRNSGRIYLETLKKRYQLELGVDGR
jgi:hypothetical protein